MSNSNIKIFKTKKGGYAIDFNGMIIVPAKDWTDVKSGKSNLAKNIKLNDEFIVKTLYSSVSFEQLFDRQELGETLVFEWSKKTAREIKIDFQIKKSFEESIDFIKSEPFEKRSNLNDFNPLTKKIVNVTTHIKINNKIFEINNSCIIDREGNLGKERDNRMLLANSEILKFIDYKSPNKKDIDLNFADGECYAFIKSRIEFIEKKYNPVYMDVYEYEYIHDETMDYIQTKMKGDVKVLSFEDKAIDNNRKGNNHSRINVRYYKTNRGICYLPIYNIGSNNNPCWQQSNKFKWIK
jgi:hypothetical protein